MNSNKGLRIMQARKNAGLTLEELGSVVGVSRATIKRYETGEISNIPSDKIEKIAKATNVTESYIMGWETLVEDNAVFHASILKNVELLEMIEKFMKLSQADKMIINTMIQSLSEKK